MDLKPYGEYLWLPITAVFALIWALGEFGPIPWNVGIVLLGAAVLGASVMYFYAGYRWVALGLLLLLPAFGLLAIGLEGNTVALVGFFAFLFTGLAVSWVGTMWEGTIEGAT